MSPITKEAKDETKKEEVKELTKEPTVVIPEPTLILAEEDAYILDVQKSQPKTLEEVLMVKEKRYVPGEHRLTLPKEIKVFESRFTFRWVNKKKRAVDDAKIKGWVIVNRVLFSDVAREAKHLFSTSGAIERGDTILMFMSKKIAEQIRKAPGEKSNQMLKTVKLYKTEKEEKLPSPPPDKSGLFTPDNTGEKEDDKGQGLGLQEGRDF